MLGILSENTSASLLELWRREAHQLVANGIPVKGTPWSVEIAMLHDMQGQAGRFPRLRCNDLQVQEHTDHKGNTLAWTGCTCHEQEIWEWSPVLPRDGESNSVL